ncbi:MAG TPA: threonine/serine exporter family protein [Defluviitaleaceae bacterium]|nr:threonine/serine exporter [Candidatus Epulonipiscium sp.]HOQ17148.1 threonine/serine exporter family protein [Defluviitaleaceae bacterium]HPT76521.1 threonine/serine exporter family protein [Defluviitaleaceae bacterium]HQD50697.1 threonine/serine exporter family protein [Defluviitaleaceae bacterium]
MILQIISAFFATFFFAILFNVSKKELGYCGLVGSLGWLIYLFIFKWTDSVIFSNFISALSISIISRILAKLRKMPITIFLIPGIIPLVPGAGMYKTMYAVLNQNFKEAAFYGAQTFEIAGAIAIAIIFISSFDTLSHKKTK